jgi:glycerophosphoryl diester phosphodiesterase
MAMEAPLVAALRRHGYRGPKAPVFIQSFEVGNLKQLARITRLPLVQLMDAGGRPYDFVVSGDPRTYADLATSAGLREVSRYARAIGVHKDMLIPRDAGSRLGEPSSLVKDAHAAGLAVHAWTFRAENRFLPADFRRGDDPTAIGDMAGELKRFLELGLDGYFTDHAAIAGASR